jgi:hypothetical protein
MTLIGTEIAKMHVVNIIHGDLTTSNMMLRRRPPNSYPPAEIVRKTKNSPIVCRQAKAILLITPCIYTLTDFKVLIDFGLTSTSALPEDKAVDLYVLERAFSSTHPDSEPLFQSVLNAYAARSGEKVWQPISRRLDEGKFACLFEAHPFTLFHILYLLAAFLPL